MLTNLLHFNFQQKESLLSEFSSPFLYVKLTIEQFFGAFFGSVSNKLINFEYMMSIIKMFFRKFITK